MILESLRDAYPEVLSDEFIDGYHLDRTGFIANISYLIEHDLIKRIGRSGTFGEGIASDIMQAKITAKGLDFLADDGGISAILKTFTVKFDPDDLRKIIESRLDKSDIPPDKKESAKSLIKDASAQAWKSLCTKLINTGVDKVTDLYGLVQTTLTNPPPS